MLDFVNIVATGDLDVKIDYGEIINNLNIPYVRYDPEIHQGLELRFTEGGPLVTLYSTGKYIIRAESLELVRNTRKQFLDSLNNIGIIPDSEDKNFNINNTVSVGGLDREIDLNALSKDLDFGDITYDSSNHPAIVCELERYNCTIMLFRTGKIIVMSPSQQNAKVGYTEFRDRVLDMFQTNCEN